MLILQGYICYFTKYKCFVEIFLREKRTTTKSVRWRTCGASSTSSPSTTCFGHPPPPTPQPTSPKDAPSESASAAASKVRKKSGGAGAGGNRKSPPDDQGQSQPKSPSQSLAAAAKDSTADLEAEMSGACPRLGAFYEFFSLANLTPPIQCESNLTLPSLFDHVSPESWSRISIGS